MMMAEKHTINTITVENMELESGDITDIADYSYTSADQASDDNTMDRVKMGFFIGDFDDLDSMTEETVNCTEEQGDKPSLPEQTANIFAVYEEEDGNLRLHSGVLEGLLAETSPHEETTDRFGKYLRTTCDILECMTINSSPAEQTIDLLADISGDFGRNDLYPPEENDSEDVQATRAPTSIVIGSNHKFAVGSRYLSAPCASYHDLCKSGHQRYLEDPKRRILGPIQGARPLMRTTGDAFSVSKAETKKQALLRRSSLPGFIMEKDHPQTHVVDINRCKKDVDQSKLKRVPGEIKPPCVPTSGDSSSRSKSESQAGKKMVVRTSKMVENSSQPVKGIKTRKKVGSHSRVTKEKAKEPMNNPVSPKTLLTQQKSPTMKTRTYQNLPSFPRSKNQSKSEEAKVKSSVRVPEKTLYMIEPSSDKKLAKRALKLPSSRKSLQNAEKAKETMSGPSSPKTPVTLKRSTGVKATIYKNQKSFSRSKNQNKPEETKITGAVAVPEKTLYMIEPNSDKKPFRRASISALSNKNLNTMEPKSNKKPSRRASMSASSSKQLPNGRKASPAGENKGIEENQKGIESNNLSPLSTSASISVLSTAEETDEPLGENQQPTDSMNIQQISATTEDGKRTETCQPDKDSPSWMVKLRRGTMVASQVADTSPERLQYREGSNLGDDQNAEDEVVCLQRTELTCNEALDTRIETQKILLRHQEKLGKKGSVDLNNVIEETASILVKSRKSKVKALVGAFETVISLNDRKPWAETRVS